MATTQDIREAVYSEVGELLLARVKSWSEARRLADRGSEELARAEHALAALNIFAQDLLNASGRPPRAVAEPVVVSWPVERRPALQIIRGGVA